IPVISTVAQGTDDDTGYNINADLAASKLAVALQAEKLILLTDVRGLLLDRNDENTLLPEIKVSGVPKLIKDGVIAGGMIPKVDCCVEAVREGVRQANIQDGRVAHSILIELFSDKGVGTMFF
ncbi:MAG: acetylglutamate kinase, partial [Oscillospiraceae bacterium]|nr:acetylglutamate kinase [Oscillospiraceae bacterium]